MTRNVKAALASVTALAMVFAFATPAAAAVNSSYIKVEISNSGSIENYTKASSNTGENWAGGSKGGRGGSGGDVGVDGSGEFNNGAAEAGNGGHGGNASAGGLVHTGDAMADAGTMNSLNTNDVQIDLYGEDMNSSKLKVELENGEECGCNTIANETRARARTGDNDAEGSKGGKGGYGGDVEASSGDNNNGGAVAGHGGHGGAGGLGGEVRTGHAVSNAGVVNMLNNSIVRVFF